MMKLDTAIRGFFCCFLLSALLAGLGGCLPRLDPGPPPVRIRLNPAMPGGMAGTVIKQQLTVASPELAQDIDNDRIVLIFPGREVRRLSDARWSSGLDGIMNDALVGAFDSTGAFAGIGDELSGLASKYRLNSDIRLFALEYASENGPAEARFIATFRLLDTIEARVVASRTIDIKVPAGGMDTQALVGALEKALEQGLDEVCRWVVASVR